MIPENATGWYAIPARIKQRGQEIFCIQKQDVKDKKEQQVHQAKCKVQSAKPRRGPFGAQN